MEECPQVPPCVPPPISPRLPRSHWHAWETLAPHPARVSSAAIALGASPARDPSFATQACHISTNFSCIPFNFPATGTHCKTIKYHGTHNLNLIYYFLFFMLCLCFNFCNMCECFYFSRVRNIYFIDIKMYKLILIFPIIIFLCLFSNKRKKFISPSKLKKFKHILENI